MLFLLSEQITIHKKVTKATLLPQKGRIQVYLEPDVPGTCSVRLKNPQKLKIYTNFIFLPLKSWREKKLRIKTFFPK